MKKTKKLLSFSLSFIMLFSITAGIDFSAIAASLYWPVPGHTTLSQGYHDGNAIDISDSKIAGATIIAAMGGTVTHKYTCTSQHYGSLHNCDGFGTGIVIKGTDGRIYQYAHMKAGSIPSNVYKGAKVSAGQTVGKVGTTGNSTGNHLHFGISYNNFWEASGINPAKETYIYSSTTAPSCSGIKMSKVKDTTARIDFNINNPSGLKITTCGVQIRKSGSSSWTTKKETITSAHQKLTTIPVFYEIGSGKEFNYALSKGTTYEIRGYCTYNEKNYYTATISFKTTGTSTCYHNSYTYTITKSATCTNTGIKHYTCKNCGYEWNETIRAKGHTIVTDKAVAATCTKSGKTQGQHCSVCNTVITAVHTTPATGHNYVNNRCTVCGNKTIPYNGWSKEKNNWYYYKNGNRAKGWLHDCGNWYYLDSNTGAMTTGWQKVRNKWYYMNSSGAMQTGWVKLSNKWYYLNANGAMLTGWQKIGGAYYYFNSSGVMLSNQWVGNYYVNSSGKWTKTR